MYQVIKTLPTTPGPGLRTVAPERDVVMSRHRSRQAAERAVRRCQRSHRGYAAFRIEEAHMQSETIEYNGIHPQLADRLSASDAGECWSSPQEMEQDVVGSHPHGLVDECSAGGRSWYRIWHDQRAVWLLVPPATD